jgi:molybdenum cofactor guanylyltransferase
MGTDTAAIVLAGGTSTRMGTSKAALAWNNATLLEHVVAIVSGGVGRVVVVAAPEQALPTLSDVEVVYDDHPGRGPLEGLRTGLTHLGPGRHVFVTATDMPFLTAGLAAHVLAALTDDIDAVVPIAEGRRQPLAAAYRSDLVALITRLLDEDVRSMNALLDHCRVRTVDLADPGVVTSLNTPGEYEAAVQAIRVNRTGVPASTPPPASGTQASAVAPTNEVTA